MSETTRGTTNGNARGSVVDRRARRAFLMLTYASDVVGYSRCYRCGVLLYSEDAVPEDLHIHIAMTLTVDRIIPACHGGTYRRNNIRPACIRCNSATGGATRRKP